MKLSFCAIGSITAALIGLHSLSWAEGAASSSGVTSLNGLKGKLTLAAGTGTSITKTGSKTLTITGLTLPYSASLSTSSHMMSLSNAGSGGLYVLNTGGNAISGINSGGVGVYGYSDSAGSAILGIGIGAGNAGKFWGNVDVTGTLSKGAGSFKIDHPLDPENKYLYHSFVESPDMMNIYNGNVVMDENGEAVVELPEWFEALNKDFRYQLTCIGGFAPVYVKDKMEGSRFAISGGQPGMEVSWQVTGIRQDPFANAHRIPVEEPKPELERGYYLHPDAYGLAEDLGVLWARHGDLLRRQREEPARLAPHDSGSVTKQLIY